MPEPPDPRPTDDRPDPKANEPMTLWRGSGLCCEAQGDGVPCQGTDGECEHCGKALPERGSRA